jgi:hypothetical protein
MPAIPTTPDFPAWAGAFAAQVQRLRATLGPTLRLFETLFGAWIPAWRLAQQDDGPHSRDRRWNLRLTFWTFLWQVAHPGTACRNAIREAQSWCQNGGRRPPPDQNSPYCQARAALPIERLQEIHDRLAADADAAIATKDLWCGHRVLVVDGTTVTAADTPANQEAYPQLSVQRPGCGFPILRLVAFLSLATGLLSAWAIGQWHQSEVALLQSLWECLRPSQVLLGDRGFCNWGLLAHCRQRQVHAVFRVKGRRRRDFRYGRRLSSNERLVHWRKPRACGATFTPAQWAALPAELTLRLVRCRLERPGLRTKQLILVTTLLDSVNYPPEALSQLYYRRWAMELTLRNLKTTLQMEHLSCKTPANLERELRLHLLVHNLVRRLMLEAARRQRVPLERVSFAGSLAVARSYSEALLAARSEARRRQLRTECFRVLAADLVPERPGRREPRAVKRRPKPYARLMCHRRKFREIQHQNRYYANSVFGPKYRKSSRA